MPYTRVVRSGDSLEVYEYATKPHGFTTFRKKGVRRKKGSTGSNRAELLRRVDNVYRAKRSFQRLVRSNFRPVEQPALLTLTMFETLSVAHAYAALTVFFGRLRALAGAGFRYIAVPEFQKRGSVHFHILIWGLPKKYAKRERSYRTLQHLWQRGFVDCVQTDGSPKLVGYLTKYMSKAMFDQRLFGAKAYSASRNALRPLLFRLDEEFDDVADYFLPVSNSPLQDRQFMTQWLGKGRYRLYN